MATGVEFTHGNKKCVVHARKEVILSAGSVQCYIPILETLVLIGTPLCISTIKSPQILELSGIGRRDVLDRVGIPVKLELPGVGENVQDHLLSGKSTSLRLP